MTGLLLLASALALGSGLIQLLGKGRIPGTVPLIALVELLAGLAVPFLALTRQVPAMAGGILLTSLVALVLYSSLTRTLRTRARLKHREETEAARLETYVRYLSARAEADKPAEGQGEP